MKEPPETVDPPTKTTPPGKTAPSEADRPKPPWWIFGALVGGPVILVVSFGAVARSPLLLLVELLLGVAALVVGILSGFLFGIPRTQTMAETDSGGGSKGREDGSNRLYDKYRPGTSLEQIADWLTKILIGVGLIQVRAIGNALAELGGRAGKSFGASASGTDEFTQLVVIVFATTGFLVSYLWTRIHYGAIQTFADQDVWAKLKEFFTKIDAQLAEQTAQNDITRRVANASAAGLTPAAAAPTAPLDEQDEQSESGSARERAAAGIESEGLIATDSAPGNESEGGLATERALGKGSETNTGVDLKKLLKDFARAPNNWGIDTVATIFGDRPEEQNGRRLEAEMADDLEDSVLITLRVRRVSGPPLKGHVTFLLHPSYPRRTIRAKVKGDVAEQEIVAAEWFTVGAIPDEEETVLTFDLRKTPNAPAWFTQG